MGKARRAGILLAEQARLKELPWRNNKAADVYLSTEGVFPRICIILARTQEGGEKDSLCPILSAIARRIKSHVAIDILLPDSLNEPTRTHLSAVPVHLTFKHLSTDNRAIAVSQPS